MEASEEDAELETSGALIRQALSFDLEGSVSRERAGRCALIGLGLGALLSLPGALLALYLDAAEEHFWAAQLPHGGTYPSLEKLFLFPCIYGVSISLTSVFRATKAVWPWIDSAGFGARLVRMVFVLIVLSVIGCGLLYLVWAFTQA